jgi:hypothetical protein
MEIYELYEFVNLNGDTKICEANFLQRLLPETVFGDYIIDTAMVFDVRLRWRKAQIACAPGFVY